MADDEQPPKTALTLIMAEEVSTEVLPVERHMSEVQHLEESIIRLRELGTKDALRFADDLEVRLLVIKRKVDRIDQMTVERLGEWVQFILREVIELKKPTRFIKEWPEHLRDEMFQAVQTAWAASRFRVREAASTLGINDVSVVTLWMKSEEWQAWQRQKGRRVSQIASLADLAMERMAHILSLDTNDPEILKIQRATAKDVITAGLQVPQDVPKGGNNRPASHQQPDGMVRAKPPKAVK